MPVGDLLNWDFIMPKYTDKQWENIIKELEKRKQQKKEGEKISARMVQYHVRNAGEKIGIQLSPHRLRHTFANMCVDNGLDVSYLKEILGHESLATTEVYLHPTFDKIKGRFLEVMEE